MDLLWILQRLVGGILAFLMPTGSVLPWCHLAPAPMPTWITIISRCSVALYSIIASSDTHQRAFGHPMGPYCNIQTKIPCVLDMYCMILVAHGTNCCLGPGTSTHRTGTLPASANTTLHSRIWQFAGSFNTYTKTICKHKTRRNQYYHLRCCASVPWKFEPMP